MKRIIWFELNAFRRSNKTLCYSLMLWTKYRIHQMSQTRKICKECIFCYATFLLISNAGHLYNWPHSSVHPPLACQSLRFAWQRFSLKWHGQKSLSISWSQNGLSFENISKQLFSSPCHFAVQCFDFFDFSKTRGKLDHMDGSHCYYFIWEPVDSRYVLWHF